MNKPEFDIKSPIGHRDLLALCYGGGLNTVALLIESAKQGVVFDVILFADTAGESQETYEHIELMNIWCILNGQPEITIVRKKDKHGQVLSLYDTCITNEFLPSIAYGHKTCSQKFKIGPQDVYMNNWPPAKETWANGYKVIKFIGYDADESHRMKRDFSDGKYNFVYKLVDWDWGRFECTNRILLERLPLPPKSSCTFCPSMKAKEVINLYSNSPDEFFKAIHMERTAQRAGNLLTVQGLGRHWSWWDLVVAYRYFNWFKRHETVTSLINPKVKTMVKRVNRSQKQKKIKRETIDSSSSENLVCDLFRTNNDIPCGCYDGGNEE